MAAIAPGNYRHFKGFVCEVIGTARHSEDLSELVIYYHTNDAGIRELWARPQAMFLEVVTVDGKEIPRFTRID